MNARELYNEEEGGEDTGGQWVNSFGKAEFFFGRTVFFFEGDLPIWQELLGQQLLRKFNFNLGLRFRFDNSLTINGN